MCGITGILNLRNQPVDARALRRMADSIAHRGPDGEGFMLDGSIGLGHRRLAIIDTSEGGRQPMQTADGRFSIVYNGEVYNFAELRKELEHRGCRFRSRSDSEVVLEAWAAWGPASVGRFNGMFAFAIWDAVERTLHLVRDRYGIKPLYHARWGDIFLFGSEQRAILTHPAARREVDLEGLREYFTFQNIFTDRTLLCGVRMLPAGSMARVDRNGSLMIKRYWDYRFHEPTGRVDVEAYREELDRLLGQAVRRQLVADVELGAYLSGGIDSGLVTAMAARDLPHVKSFTCGFDLSSASGLELGFDERQRAEAMSACLRTELYEMVLKAGDMERCLPRVVRHIEEPRVGQSYPNFYIAQLASKFVKVVLAGDGGDELFGGYPWRYFRAARATGFNDYVERYYAFWHRLVEEDRLQRLFGPVASKVDGVCTRTIFRNVFASHENELARPEDFVNHSLYFEARTFLHGIFTISDKLSMAHGLETRVPFMDNDLVDFAMTCPMSLKLNNLAGAIRLNENEPGNKKGNYDRRMRDGKQILRQVALRHMPREIAEAEKQGFSSPDASWFKGESMAFVRRSLMEGPAPIYDILDRTEAHALLEEHLSGRQNRRLLIWSLLSVNEYLRQLMGEGGQT